MTSSSVALEAIASALVEATACDAGCQSRLEAQFRELSVLLAQEQRAQPLELASASADLLANCGRQNPVVILDIVSRAVSALQQSEHGGWQTCDDILPAAIREFLSASPLEEPANTTVAEPSATPVFEEAADPELVAGFLSESAEHLSGADAQLLALESDPTNKETLNSIFRCFHTIKGLAAFLGFGHIAALAHVAEDLLDRARNGQLLLSGPAMDVAFAAVDSLKVGVTHVGDPGRLGAWHTTTLPLMDSIQAVLDGKAAVVLPTKSPAASETDAEQPPAAAALSSPVVETKEAVRVDRDRLDKLVDMIGELVIAESVVHQDFIIGSDPTRSARNLSQLNKITRGLQELSLSLRMVPVRGTFQKMARLVRDLSRKMGKAVDFHTSGDETELDKTVVDQIGDPLMHLVRNSLDHGLEATAEERTARGKPASGQVTLRAFHQGGNIYIEIEDDGRGLNRERILNKARERGLAPQHATLSDAEVFNLIFEAGFSTAERLTDISGRGVGMDVVRRNVEALHGAIALRSEAGRGTTVSLRLPLTLAIIDGMVVRIGGNRYILPTLAIVELLRPKPEELATVVERGELLVSRGRCLPLVRVGRLFNVSTAADPTDAIVVVVEDGNTTAGLVVDEVLGQQQVVIKSLGADVAKQRGLSGGAVMPDGTVGLILDVHDLLAVARGGSSEG